MKNKKVISAICIVFIIVLGILGYIALEEKNNSNVENTNNKQEEVKGNYDIVEAMKHIEATNTVEEINAIIGFESTTDAMIGSDPIWKFDSKNWISYKKSSNDNITIQATIDKESIKIYAKDDENMVSFRVKNANYLNYEYLNSFDIDNATKKNYYDNIDSFDSDYIKLNGKKANMSKDGLVEISIDKKISNIAVVATSQDGTTSDVYVIDVYSSIPYIGAKLIGYTLTELRFSIYVYSSENIASIDASVSSDGISFINNTNVEIPTGTTNEFSHSFLISVPNNIKKNIFLKIGLNDKYTSTQRFTV